MSPNVNLQRIPTPILWLASIFSNPAVILGYGTSTLADLQSQTVAFGSTLSAVPSVILFAFVTPVGGLAAVIDGDSVDGSYTVNGFDIVLQANPGDALHKIVWLALS